jgi:hypothetical protein
MPRKNKRQKVKASPLPAVEMVGPTDAQRANGNYVSADIIYIENFTRATAYVNKGFEDNGRLFKSRHLDRLHKAGRLSDAQYAAGVWYRDEHEKCRYDQPQMVDLHRVGGGSTLSVPDWKEIARNNWRLARLSMPTEMIGFMDALILHNRWPKMHHRERFRTIGSIQRALDDLASHLLKRKR